MEPYKHPLTLSINKATLALVFLGLWGGHRFYFGQTKVGLFIMSLSVMLLLADKMEWKISGLLMVALGCVWLYEILTFYPRIRRHNEGLTQYNYDKRH